MTKARDLQLQNLKLENLLSMFSELSLGVFQSGVQFMKNRSSYTRKIRNTLDRRLEHRSFIGIKVSRTRRRLAHSGIIDAFSMAASVLPIALVDTRYVFYTRP